MSQVHPLANFPFKVTLKDGTVKHTNLLSFTHGRIVSLSVPREFQRISLDEIVKIEVEDHSTDLKQSNSMAHVIEPPRPEDFKQARCPGCRSLIAYVPNEIKKYSGRDISGGPDGREWIICPVRGCGKDITLRSW